MCDHAVVIANGTVLFDGSPEALQASTNPLIQQFLRGDPDGPIAFASTPTQQAA